MVERTHVAAPKAEPPLSGFVTAGDIELDWRRRQVRVGQKSVQLTPNEAELFWYLLSKRGRVVSHRELLRSIWGDAYVGSLNYLHVLIKTLRKKRESNLGPPAAFTRLWTKSLDPASDFLTSQVLASQGGG